MKKMEKGSFRIYERHKFTRKCPKFIIGRIQGKFSGGVGMGSQLTIVIQNLSFRKFSELALGIGPFVVTVERKIETRIFCHDNKLQNGTTLIGELDKRIIYWKYLILLMKWIKKLINLKILSKSSPESMMRLKKIIWQGTEHWDQLLIERASLQRNISTLLIFPKSL